MELKYWQALLLVAGFFAVVAGIEYLLTGGLLVQSWHVWRP